MRSMLAVAAIMAAIFVSSPVYAVTLKPGSPACLTEDLYSQLGVAVSQNDMDALNWLGSHGCTVSDKPLHVTVLEMKDWGSLAHVRAYRGKVAVEVWTPRESLAGYDPVQR